MIQIDTDLQISKSVYLQNTPETPINRAFSPPATPPIYRFTDFRLKIEGGKGGEDECQPAPLVQYVVAPPQPPAATTHNPQPTKKSPRRHHRWQRGRASDLRASDVLYGFPSYKPQSLSMVRYVVALPRPSTFHFSSFIFNLPKSHHNSPGSFPPPSQSSDAPFPQAASCRQVGRWSSVCSCPARS